MRHRLFIHSTLFVLGFSLVFALLGVFIESLFLSASVTIKRLLSYLGGIIITALGLQLIGLINIPFLEVEKRYQVKETKYAYLSSFLFGVGFGAGWSPCIGAILGAIMTMAAINPANAVVLMIAYSLGIGIPFMLIGVVADRAHGLMKKINKHLRSLQIAFGALLIILGVLIFTNALTSLAHFTATSQLFVNIDSALASRGVSIGVAFLAGLASFMSPCIFPLLPAYLAYLGGLSVKTNKE